MTNNTPDYEDNLYFDSQNTKKDLCITVEKQVWESTLRRSMELQAENYKLKDVITEMCCQLVDDDDDMSLGLAEYFDQDLLIKIREAL